MNNFNKDNGFNELYEKQTNIKKRVAKVLSIDENNTENNEELTRENDKKLSEID